MPDPDSSPPWYDNRSLFSDHYLEERLPHGDAWEEDVSEAWARAREIWEDAGDRLEGLNEAQTEDEFIRPVLESVLGFERTVQTGVRHRERLSRPDYLLFADEEAKRRSEEAEDDAGRYEPAVAVADAKYWGRPLDRHLDDARDELSHANPSFQIVDYLVATGVEWGVLTNGARWRLYYTGARSRIDTFYEADLERILREGDDDAFRWFQLFFRAGAFVPAPQVKQSFLASVHEGSVEYGARLESQLKELIFEDVFLHLARGFLEDWQANGNGEPDQERLDEIYQGTLRLLYRLLFLLHAEARGLLPVEQRKGYRSYSLRSIVRDAAEMLDEGATLSAVSTNLWNDLDSLFRIIDRGESDLDVPHYDGGLFRQGHPENAFLENHAVADRHLVPALDLLAREQEPDDRGRKPFVDYKTLNVQQLGSIYEGLLEFKLQRAEEELAVVKADGTEVYEPASEVEEPRQTVAQGDLYLMNDKGERKATGSYYTPHYIVEYIVEHTLGPVLEEREERFRDIMERLEEKPGDALLQRKAVDALLGIKVCDPAMGSGHFLVHATDWLAEHIVAVLNEFPGNPLLQKIEEAREEILEELVEQDVEVDGERLTDTGLLKRMVMKRCIYGVDLNPMAVELAKLSLWLDSFTVGAPLSFLDHHLKQGNSLIGTTVGEVRQAIEFEGPQRTVFGGPFSGVLTAANLIEELTGFADVTPGQIQHSTRLYDSFEAYIAPYKSILDLWLSAKRFDNLRADKLLRSHGAEILTSLRETDTPLPDQYSTILTKAHEASLQHSFFHWELEFPEVYIDLSASRWKENPGFDVMLGNPPYGKLDKAYRDIFLKDYTVTEYFSDSFALFVEAGTSQLRDDGILSFIVPEPWLTEPNSERLRRHVTSTTWIRRIARFTHPVFPDATVDNVVIVLQKTSPDSITIERLDNPSGEIASRNLVTSYAQASIEDDQYRIEIRQTDAERRLVQKIRDAGQSLETLTADISIGIQAYNRSKHTPTQIENRVFHSRTPEGPDYYPEIRGRDVSRYSISIPEDRWVQYGEHLHDYRPLAYFTRDRILVREIVGDPPHCIHAAFCEQEAVNYKTVLIVLPKPDEAPPHYVVGLLNSSLLCWYYGVTSQKIVSDTFPRISVADLRRIPAVPVSSHDGAAPALPPDVASTLDECLIPDRDADIQQITESVDAHGPESAVYSIAHLAEQQWMRARRRSQLSSAFDPFKYFERSTSLVPLREAWREELKYAEVTTDISERHDDIDSIRLRKADAASKWDLEICLKKRDPDSDWKDWIKVEGTRRIAREWVRAMTLRFSARKGHYYRYILDALEQFDDFSSFPGGATRSTMTKLLRTSIPPYDPDVDIEPLVEIATELEELCGTIELCDRVIDQILYRLYDLTGQEIDIVERTESGGSR